VITGWLGACAPNVPSADPVDTTLPEESAVGEGDTDPPDPEENDYGCSSLFDQDRLVVYEAYIHADDWDDLNAQWSAADGTKAYVPLQALLLDGEEIPWSEIRLKGNSGCCWVGDKMQFVIAFDGVDEEARVEGQRKVALDAPYYEPTVLKNRLANRFMQRVGVPGACTNNALLYVNGEYYGIYAHMEELDHEFLERVYGKEFADGFLWKYGVELDNHEGEEVDTSRLDAFWATTEVPDMVPFGEPDQWVSEWVSEAVLPDGDGYWCCAHNYYLYDHPERGFLWVPWDKDGTFDWVPVQTDPTTLWYPTYTPHLAAFLADPSWSSLYREEVARQTSAYGDTEMMDDLEKWTEQTEPWALEEPHRYYDNATYSATLENLPTYIRQRRQYLDRWAAANPP